MVELVKDVESRGNFALEQIIFVKRVENVNW